MVWVLLSAFLVLSTLPASASVSFSGTFYNTPSNPNSIISADLDRDGLPDMAIASGNIVSVYLATTAGKFGAEKDYNFFGNSAVGGLVAADFNGDGALDLMVGEQGRAQVAILWNNGDGTFRSGPIVKFSAPVASFDVGDFNHDGILDIATIECTSGAPVSCSMNSYRGKGKGVFAKVQSLKLLNPAFGIQVADMNGDGILDVTLARVGEVLIWWGKGDGMFSGPTHLNPNTSDDVESFAIADFTNDAKLDVVIDTGTNLSTFTGCVSGGQWFYKNMGGEKFSLLWGRAGGGCTVFNPIDMNGDLNEDLIEQNGDPDAGFFAGVLGNGDGTFRSPPSESFPNQGGGAIYVRDVNLDSRDDYIVGFGGINEAVVALQTGGSKSCKPPGSAKLAAKICTPAAGARISSPVLVQAAGNSPAGVIQLQVWIDGVKRAVKWHDELSKKFSLASGPHRIAIVATDKYLGTAKTFVNITVP